MNALTLPASGRSAAAARSFVRSFCRTHAVPVTVEVDALLLTSELMSNTYLHARSAAKLCLAVTAGVLLIEVSDDCPTHPVLGTAVHAAESGRGVMIMDALAHRWGVRAHATGKTVWFELAVGRATRA